MKTTGSDRVNNKTTSNDEIENRACMNVGRTKMKLSGMSNAVAQPSARLIDHRASRVSQKRIIDPGDGLLGVRTEVDAHRRDLWVFHRDLVTVE